MPNGATHIATGAIISPILYLAIKNNIEPVEPTCIEELLLSTFIGISTARIPDILEPPISPNHRAFFHSIVWGGFVGYVGFQIWKDLQIKRNERKLFGIRKMSQSEIIEILLLIGAGSILVHLLFDGFTKKGLPFI
jgi:membrane-bound metal-dependent hydrolase YbcI (DUF457 family)